MRLGRKIILEFVVLHSKVQAISTLGFARLFACVNDAEAGFDVDKTIDLRFPAYLAQGGKAYY
jgi:hypothetical protein